MSRINSNVPSLLAQANLNSANNDLDLRLRRLSTGLKINRGSDDPAGLIISQRLGASINGLQTAVGNSERASSVLATADGALSEVSDLLNSIKGLVVQAANTGALSDDERKANQLQIDSAIQSITRISNSASFGSLKLLNGDLDYVLSGLNTTDVAKASVHSATFGGASNIQVRVDTVASAQLGSLFLRGDYSGGFGNGVLQSSVTLEIAGSKGRQVLQFLSGRPFSEVVAAVNSLKDSTGVSASLVNGNANSGLSFNSTDFGSSQFVSVQRIGGPSGGGFWQTYQFANDAARPSTVDIPTLVTAGTLVAANRDSGRDVVAVVNGALGTGKGLSISLPSTTLSLDLTLTQTFATQNGQTSSFYITGGGATYQLGGDVNTSQQINVGLPSIAASRLGGTLINGTLQFLSSILSGGGNDLNSQNFQSATEILSTAVDEVSVARGRLGALEKNTLETNLRSIQASIENLTASQSTIKDADFAAETSSLTRAQILASASTSALSLANQRSQNVLKLLG